MWIIGPEVPKLARYQLRYTRMTELYYSKVEGKSPLKIVEKRQWAAEMIGERGLTTEVYKVDGEKLWLQKQRKASEI